MQKTALLPQNPPTLCWLSCVRYGMPFWRNAINPIYLLTSRTKQKHLLSAGQALLSSPGKTCRKKRVLQDVVPADHFDHAVA
jgi:hypothetical protein